jgi:SulP family sulfate permease
MEDFSMLFRALRESKALYSSNSLLQDIRAGLIVGCVALPLGLALAVAVNVPPQNGLYTAAIAGIIAALTGGSRFQVTGPTAAFVVVLLPIVHRFGLAGLLYAGFLAGIILCLFSLLKLGKIIRVIPFPVTTGFTLGIGIVIFTLQIKDLLGLDIVLPKEYVSKLLSIVAALPNFNKSELAIGGFTIGIYLVIARLFKRTPAPILALSCAVVVAELIRHWYPSFQVATIASRYSYLHDGVMVAGLPAGLPSWQAVWSTFPSVQDAWHLTVEILPGALTIAVLGAIESLLSAVVADTMTRTRHDPDGELLAQGLSNMLCPFFGGIPACGAIARTATNIRFGAVSPVAAITHGVVILLSLAFATPLLGKIPMAALAALLTIVAYHMIDVRHIASILRSGSREDRIVFATVCALTVIFDMTVGVAVGVVLAALLFVRTVAGFTAGKWAELSAISLPSNGESATLPPYVQLYELEGPLFFGAAERAIAALEHITSDVKAVIIDFKQVPFIDISGLTALHSSLEILAARHHLCIACNVAPNVAKGIVSFLSHTNVPQALRIVGSRQQALQESEKWREV